MKRFFILFFILFINSNFYSQSKQYVSWSFSQKKISADEFELIFKANGNEAEQNKLFKKLYEKSQKGDLRVIKGYISRSEDLQATENETGMIKFLDAELMAKGEFPERLINLRNIVSLIFKLTKYELK